MPGLSRLSNDMQAMCDYLKEVVSLGGTLYKEKDFRKFYEHVYDLCALFRKGGLGVLDIEHLMDILKALLQPDTAPATSYSSSMSSKWATGSASTAKELLNDLKQFAKSWERFVDGLKPILKQLFPRHTVAGSSR